MMEFSDLLWLMLFALVGALSLLQSQRRFGYWFTPVSLFTCITCLSICVYHLRLLGMNDVSVATHLIVLTSLLAFAGGSALAIDRTPPPAVPLHTTLDTRGLSAFFYITAIVSLVGWVVAAAILVVRHGGVGALIASLWVLQTEFQMPTIGYLNLVGILVLPAFVLKWATGRRRPLDILLALSAVWGLLLAGIKAYVFYAALAATVTWSLVRPDRFRPRHFALVVVVLLVFFVAYNSLVDIFMPGIHTAGNTWFSKLPQLHWPYVYFVGAWPAMDNIVHGKLAPPAAVGAMTLQPIWKVLGDFLGLVEPVPFAQPFSDIGTTLFNVYSFFGVLYQEWKWPGPLLMSGLLGFVSTRLYLRVRRGGYWGHLLVYATFAWGLFMSCFMYDFRFNMVVLLFWLYAVGFVALRGGVLIDRRRNG